MRSNYWGQGGHNAIFIVGDFFREALAKARSAAKPSSRVRLRARR
jgi:penicillin-binding protein 1A